MALGIEVNRFIRSIQGIIERIPLTEPVTGERVFIDPSVLTNVPQHLKSKFKIVLRYKLNLSFKGACFIYSPKEVVTIVIVIDKKYETIFHQFNKQFPSDKHLNDVCERRSVYIHEICHLAAAIRLFPKNYDANTRKDFISAIEKKFAGNDKGSGQSFAHFDTTIQPFASNNEHFSFNNDKFDYQEFYKELMVSDAKIEETVKKMFEPEMYNKLNHLTIYQWFAMLTHVDPGFFAAYSDKNTKFFKEIKPYRSNTP